MIGTDYHIHTHYVGCAGSEMTIPAILEHARRVERTSIAITDHCDTPGRLAKNRMIRDELERTDPGDLEVFFGCELNIQNLDGEFFLSPEQVREERFELVLAGVHSTWFGPGEATLAQIIERQIDLMCKVASSPMVDVLVHPWWIPGSQFQGELAEQFTSLEQVPDELTQRMVETCNANGTAIEFNVGATWAHPHTADEFKASYTDYVAKWVELGARVALCSDAHSLARFDLLPRGEQVLAEIGLPDEQVWRPQNEPTVVGSKVITSKEVCNE